MLMITVATPMYDTRLPDDVLGILVAVLLLMLCFTAIGILLGSLIPTAGAAQGVGLILFFGIWIISGTVPPRAMLPDGVRRLGEVEPLTHVIITVQDPWFGFGWNGQSTLIILVVTIIAAGLAVCRFRWD
jgi:ABC-2 type transport system permease protein